MDNTCLITEVADILKELFQFDGQIEELCSMSEMEGEFKFNAETMLLKLKAFITLHCSEPYPS